MAVTPAKAGVQYSTDVADSRLRGNDKGDLRFEISDFNLDSRLRGNDDGRGWTPACAGMAREISDFNLDSRLRGKDDGRGWIPACAGMTRVGLNSRLPGGDGLRDVFDRCLRMNVAKPVGTNESGNAENPTKKGQLGCCPSERSSVVAGLAADQFAASLRD